MEIFTKAELLMRKKEIMQKIREGAVFIYPTDTIYGIGCHALDEKAVEKIRRLKGRVDKPFSVIAPSIGWIKNICDGNIDTWISKLPGRYTLIIRLKKQFKTKAVAWNVNTGGETLGIRFPDHWITRFIAEMGIPIVTTSVNKAGQPFMTDLRNLDKDIEKGVDFIIFEGEKEGRPSTLINVAEQQVMKR